MFSDDVARHGEALLENCCRIMHRLLEESLERRVLRVILVVHLSPLGNRLNSVDAMIKTVVPVRGR